MPDYTLVIANKNYSSWSLRPWLALKKGGIAFDEVLVWLDQPDTKTILRGHSPGAKAPALKTPEGTVWESIAICEWAAERTPGLWPVNAAERHEARSISAEMHAGFQALRSAMPMNLRTTGRRVPMTDALEADIARAHDIWSGCRARFASRGPWLFGRFSIADAMYAPVALRFRTYGVRGPESCQAYIDTLWNDADFQEWKRAAEQEPDMPRIEAFGV